MSLRTSRIVIKRAGGKRGGFRFTVYAGNGEPLHTSQRYAAKHRVRSGIEALSYALTNRRRSLAQWLIVDTTLRTYKPGRRHR